MSNFSKNGHAWRSAYSSQLRKINLKKQTYSEKLLYEELKKVLKGKSGITKQKVCFTKKSFIIADLYLRKYKVAIEIDGGYHKEKEQIEKDAIKDIIYISKKYKIMRFTNEEVINSMKLVLNKIFSNLETGGHGKPSGTPV